MYCCELSKLFDLSWQLAASELAIRAEFTGALSSGSEVIIPAIVVSRVGRLGGLGSGLFDSSYGVIALDPPAFIAATVVSM